MIGRRAIFSTGLLATLSVPPSTELPFAAAVPLAAAVALVGRSCDPLFLSAVRTTGRFLYRGEELGGERTGRVLAPAPDLLELDTYGSADALAYFTTLERELAASNAVARPSNGHIAVADIEAASAWGGAASVWPIGTMPLHYVWPTDRQALWPASAARRGALLDSVRVDSGLEDALRLGRELLFCDEAGAAAYVALPARADGEVRRRLFG